MTNRTGDIIESLVDGQFERAKAQTRYMCKTLPEKQAYIVGNVVGALCDPEYGRENVGLAVAYLNLFTDEHYPMRVRREK